MKNITNIILGIMGLAIAILYFLHFKSNSPQVNLNASSKDIANSAGARVAFVNIDSFFVGYKEFKKTQDEIQSSLESSKKQMETKTAAIQKEYQAFMQAAQSGQITSQAVGEAKQKDIMNRGNALKLEEEKILKSIGDRSEKATKDMYEKLNKYFTDNKAKYNCDYVMGYRTNELIFYIDKKYDITKQLVEDLNNE